MITIYTYIHKIEEHKYKYNQSIHSRIDRFYINKNQKTKDISIFPNNLSDHDGLKLNIQIKKTNSKGKGYWKLNTSILKQKEFQKIFQNFWQDWQKAFDKTDHDFLYNTMDKMGFSNSFINFIKIL